MALARYATTFPNTWRCADGESCRLYKRRKVNLFNRLTRAESYAANQLFATLDTTARRCWINDDETVVLSDTVGFIRGLPHQLVEAFKSTLDETVHADVLLHVVDSSSPVRDEQIRSVNLVLAQIMADDIPSSRC